MAIPVEDRERIRRGMARYLSQTHQSTGLTKAEWQATVDAACAWVDDNQASYLAALPGMAQTGLSAVEKALLLCAAVAALLGVEYLRRLLGNVD